MKKNIVIVLILFSTVLIAQNKLASIEVTELKLKNGLTVMLSENHNEPKIFGMVAVKAGAKNDPKDATGIAHYLEHMLFKGTEMMGTSDFEKEKPILDDISDLYEKLAKADEKEQWEIQRQINEKSKEAGTYAIPNEMDKLLTEMGATDVNAFTTDDFTAYYNTFPSNQIEKWLEIYSHRFEKPVFRLFQSELETVYEEKNMSMDDMFNRISEQLLQNIYKRHPYGQQTILGSMEHLKTPSLRKMYEFYNTYYVANNMVLALSGDFDTEAIIPLIETKFGKWRSGKIPQFPQYNEDDFKGREQVTRRLTPVKVGIMSFRTPKNSHSDKITFEMALEVLSNPEMTGFLDKISDEGKVKMAGLEHMPLNDYGVVMLYFVPKIIGQRLPTAENIIKLQLDKLKKGKFSDDYFKAIKLNKQKEIDLLWEGNESRTLEMVESFTQNKKWHDYYAQYNKVNDITKKDVIAVANKYFGDNYLCFYSKMGFPKKKRLEKPWLEPISQKKEIKSLFRTKLSKIETNAIVPKFVNFQKDITTQKISDYFTIHQVKNPFNNVFDLEIRYGVGKYKMPILQQTVPYLHLLGTHDKTVLEIKEAYAALGASYSFSVGDESFSMYIEGLDENLEAILKLTRHLLTHIKVDEYKVKQMLGDLKVERKFDRRDPMYIATSLNEYVLYGKKAPRLMELTKDQLKKLTGNELIDAFRKTLGYGTTVNYTGNESNKDIMEWCKQYLLLNDQLKPNQEVIIDRIKPKKTTFYVLNYKKTVQNHILFNIECRKRNNDDVPIAKAFNSYFGGLIFQEIRELRSLAYTAYGDYYLATKEGKNNLFVGYIGCQAGKTNEAINAMLGLIKNMPEKPESIESIRTSIIEKAQSSKPNFRALIDVVNSWKQLGYESDPNQIHLEKFNEVTLEDIVQFYKKELQNKPIAITIMGNIKKFDLKKLEKYGEIVMVNKKELFVN